jgi:hypothetical protein
VAGFFFLGRCRGGEWTASEVRRRRRRRQRAEGSRKVPSGVGGSTAAQRLPRLPRAALSQLAESALEVYNVSPRSAARVEEAEPLRQTGTSQPLSASLFPSFRPLGAYRARARARVLSALAVAERRGRARTREPREECADPREERGAIKVERRRDRETASSGSLCAGTEENVLVSVECVVISRPRPRYARARLAAGRSNGDGTEGRGDRDPHPRPLPRALSCLRYRRLRLCLSRDNGGASHRTKLACRVQIPFAGYS